MSYYTKNYSESLPSNFKISSNSGNCYKCSLYLIFIGGIHSNVASVL